MTSIDLPSWIRNLALHYFLKTQKITEINTKSDSMLTKYKIHDIVKFHTKKLKKKILT